MIQEAGVEIPMRDGTVLRAVVTRPDGEGTHPALVVRTPYGDDLPQGAVPRWVEAGYAVVVQDCRGRWSSEGEWVPFLGEPDDGFDTVEWVAGQPWCDGTVGSTGFSYLGLSSAMTVLAQPPSLRSAAPTSAAARPYDFVYTRGGVPQLSFPVGWIADVSRETARRQGVVDEHLAALPGFGEAAVAAVEHGPEASIEVQRRLVRAHRAIIAERPVRKLPMVDALAPWAHGWFDHPASTDPFWRSVDAVAAAAAGRIRTPMLHVAGWFDFWLADALDWFVAMREAGVPQRLVVGPWFHGSFGGRRSGSVDFGDDAVVDLFAEERRWHDHWLRDIDTGVLDEPPVRLFVMGLDRWRDEASWPLARAAEERWHLHADGSLSPSRPGDDEPSTFVHDPDDPAPMWGGRPGQSGRAGTWDQRERESRPDVLTFTSAPLERALEVTGPVRLEVWFASSAPSFDVVATLVDVLPTGEAMSLCEGAARSADTRGRPVVVDLLATSNVFLPGHRIRVDVASSAHPHYQPNPGTGVPIASDAPGEGITARQHVFHDRARPSALVLPVVPS